MAAREGFQVLIPSAAFPAMRGRAGAARREVAGGGTGGELARRPLGPHAGFGVEVLGLELRAGLGADTQAALASAFNRHSVLLFRGQELDDETQLAFTRGFAAALHTELESTVAVGGLQDVQPGNEEARFLGKFSNLDEHGELIPLDDPKGIYNAGNQLVSTATFCATMPWSDAALPHGSQWHSDSSYKPVAAMASCLAARLVPPAGHGGETEIASGRHAYATLPAALRSAAEDRVAVHDMSYSRGLLVERWARERPWADELPPARHRLVRRGAEGQPLGLFCGAHSSHVEGMGLAEGRELIAALNHHMTAGPDACVLRHAWLPGDLLIYDNRCCLHRGRPWQDAEATPRAMVRTTLAGFSRDGFDPEVPGGGWGSAAAAPDTPTRLAMLRAVGVDLEAAGQEDSYYGRLSLHMDAPGTA